MKLVAAAAFVTLQACVALAQDVVFIGEFHDNPAHHETQASRVASLAPAALVFEMLTEEQAAGATPDLRNAEDELRAALDWDAGGWPDFTMYYPILAAAPSARIYGAGVTRDAARQAMQDGFGGLMDDEAAAYGLDHPLPDDQQAVREALQMESHCNALPEDMLSGMVRVQRLRDAMLARAALRAFEDTGGPVAVITGNGHARKDWGAPALLARNAPRLDLHIIGQTEDDLPLSGTYDEILSAPSPEDREDPCAAFR